MDLFSFQIVPVITLVALTRSVTICPENVFVNQDTEDRGVIGAHPVSSDTPTVKNVVATKKDLEAMCVTSMVDASVLRSLEDRNAMSVHLVIMISLIAMVRDTSIIYEATFLI